MPKTILVLEDEMERIEWLRENLPKNTDIIWSSDVVDFLTKEEQLKKENKLDLIIMDYSLGRKLNGLDAVKGMTICLVPVVIWSSHLKAYDMFLQLKKEGTECFMREFGRDSLLEKLLDLLQKD